jgi:hypothetical protein
MGLILVAKITIVQNPPNPTNNIQYTRGGFMGLILVAKITIVQNPPNPTNNIQYTRGGFG